MKQVLLFCAVFIAASVSAASVLPADLVFADDGSFRVGSISAGVRIVPVTGWSNQFRNSAFTCLKRNETPSSRVLTATLPLGGGIVEQTATGLEGGAARIDFHAAFTNVQKLTAAFFEIRFSGRMKSVEIDGKPFPLPEEKGKAGLFSAPSVKSFAFMTLGGVWCTFRGPFPITLQDSRIFGENWFEIRIPLRREDGTVTELSRTFTVACERRDAVPAASFFRWGKGLPVYTNTVFTEGPEWVKADFRRTTVPGSPLDFSFLADAPAGRHGFLRRGPDGRAVFEKAPKLRARFYGGNFAWDSFLLEKAETDRVAAELVRLGYNLVRAHQHDTEFLPAGSGDSTALDPAALDKWDYFVYRMKQSGIYFTTDCYSSRAFRPGDPGLSDFANELRAMKPLLPFRRAAMENWKAFTRNLITHVNPYTGLSLADEPALICLNLVNEENLESFGRPDPRLMPVYQKAFRTWCAAEGLSDGGPMDASENRVYRRFLAESQMRVHREQLAFLRSELKVRCLLTSLNHRSGTDLVPRRAPFDLTDLHMYFSHPNHEGKKTVYGDVFTSSLEPSHVGGFWRGLLPQRLWGRPVLTTEFRHCWPNVFRCEAGPMAGAYGALQDWDGLTGYGYAEGAASLRERHYNANPFDTCNDPFALAGERLSILMFRRGDVSPAKHRVCFEVPSDVLRRKGLPMHFKEAGLLGLLVGIGSACDTAPAETLPVSLSDAESFRTLKTVPALRPFLPQIADAEAGLYRSDTDEITLDTKARTLRVVTPRTESCTLAAGALAGRFLSVSDVRHPTTVSVHALDGRPLAESRSVLAFHLTDSANDGEAFTDITMKYLRSRGHGPMLIRRDAVRITIPAGFTVTALHCDGRAAGVLPPDSAVPGTFTLRTDAFPGGILAYHLTR